MYAQSIIQGVAEAAPSLEAADVCHSLGSDLTQGLPRDAYFERYHALRSADRQWLDDAHLREPILERILRARADAVRAADAAAVAPASRGAEADGSDAGGSDAGGEPGYVVLDPPGPVLPSAPVLTHAKMPATAVTVIRDGEEYQVDPSAVVYGDVVRLKIGQPCPGCARVVACSANARVTDGARGMSATLTVAALFEDNGSASSEGGADENADDDNVDGVPVPSQSVAPEPPLRPEVNVIPASAVLVDGEATAVILPETAAAVEARMEDTLERLYAMVSRRRAPLPSDAELPGRSDERRTVLDRVVAEARARGLLLRSPEVVRRLAAVDVLVVPVDGFLHCAPFTVAASHAIGGMATITPALAGMAAATLLGSRDNIAEAETGGLKNVNALYGRAFTDAMEDRSVVAAAPSSTQTKESKDKVTTAMSWDGDEDDLDYLIGANVGLVSYGLFGAVYSDDEHSHDSDGDSDDRIDPYIGALAEVCVIGGPAHAVLWRCAIEATERSALETVCELWGLAGFTAVAVASKGVSFEVVDFDEGMEATMLQSDEPSFTLRAMVALEGHWDRDTEACVARLAAMGVRVVLAGAFDTPCVAQVLHRYPFHVEDAAGEMIDQLSGGPVSGQLPLTGAPALATLSATGASTTGAVQADTPTGDASSNGVRFALGSPGGSNAADGGDGGLVAGEGGAEDPPDTQTVANPTTVLVSPFMDFSPIEVGPSDVTTSHLLVTTKKFAWAGCDPALLESLVTGFQNIGRRVAAVVTDCHADNALLQADVGLCPAWADGYFLRDEADGVFDATDSPLAAVVLSMAAARRAFGRPDGGDGAPGGRSGDAGSGDAGGNGDAVCAIS